MQWSRHSPLERAELVQACAAQVWCCATACLPLLKWPKRVGATDDCGYGNRTEVATAERGRFVPIHQEHLIVSDDATALPSRKRVTATVTLACGPDVDSIDADH